MNSVEGQPTSDTLVTATAPIIIQCPHQIAYYEILNIIRSEVCPEKFSVLDILRLSNYKLTKREANGTLYRMVRWGVLCMTPLHPFLRGKPLFWAGNLELDLSSNRRGVS